MDFKNTDTLACSAFDDLLMCQYVYYENCMYHYVSLLTFADEDANNLLHAWSNHKQLSAMWSVVTYLAILIYYIMLVAEERSLTKNEPSPSC